MSKELDYMGFGRDDVLTGTADGFLRRAGRRLRDTLRDLADLLPVSLRRAELCWEGAPPEEDACVDTCSAEAEALFQDDPDDGQAKALADVAAGVMSRYGQVSSSVSTAETGTGKAGGSLRARVTMRPTGGRLNWAALDRDLRAAVAERHRRFRVTLTDPRSMVPRGPAHSLRGGLDQRRTTGSG